VEGQRVAWEESAPVPVVKEEPAGWEGRGPLVAAVAQAEWVAEALVGRVAAVWAAVGVWTVLAVWVAGAEEVAAADWRRLAGANCGMSRSGQWRPDRSAW